ncbi:MAG: hypothetical protein QOC94_283 [Actinoplanes sp.]|nr:hypothetical protein [Actinoplanes sp.]
MDRLDQALQSAGPLLRRVDEIIATVGAPPDHRVWAELRRVRLLPTDAVHAVAALRPAELTEAVTELRADARTYAGVAAALPGPQDWTGDAADSYHAARNRTAGHLGGGPESLEERLDATADLAEALHEWMDHTRCDLAAALAEILTSAQALDLSIESEPDPTAERTILAAADIAARLLHGVAESYATAADLIEASAELIGAQSQRA